MEGGVRTIEITQTVPSCYDLVRGLIATTGGRFPVGVGTVWDPGAVRDAKDAGASFVVTPVLLPEVAESRRRKLAILYKFLDVWVRVDFDKLTPPADQKVSGHR